MLSACQRLAPAKLNLFLHITGKRNDGYHTLQSHMMFADYGDILTFEQSKEFSLIIKGPFADQIDQDDNLVTKAVKGFCELTDKSPAIKITLEKNIPIGSGLGGGSSDAAVTLKGLIELWNIDPDEKSLQTLMNDLGADVPACFYGQSCLGEGIGEIITPRPAVPLHAVLVYPDCPCPTPVIFQNFNRRAKKEIHVPSCFKEQKSLIDFLTKQNNDLSDTACINFPVIQKCLNHLSAQKNIIFSRMSGSGSACFGLFNTKEETQKACRNILEENPRWWVKTVLLN